jgi:hypothetical protein
VCEKEYKELRKIKTRKYAQITFYKVIAAPVHMYGSENWVLSRCERKKIETAEMRFIRRASGYRSTLTEHVHNMTLGNALENIQEGVQNYKNKFRNQFSRMDT